MQKKAGDKKSSREHPAVLKITKLHDLNALFAAPIPARFELNGQIVEVEVRALTPKEEFEHQNILRRSQPKLIKGRTQADDRIEYTDPAYLEEKERIKKTARAWTLYKACPIIAAGKPGLTTPEEIFEYVQDLWNEHALEIVYLTIFQGGVNFAESTNFTTAPASAQN